jgi:hypothetical protein
VPGAPLGGFSPPAVGAGASPPSLELLGGNIPAPWTDPASWDQITVQGVTWYGKVEVKGAKRSYKLDVKDALGIEGATTSYQGKKPPKFQVIFYLWSDTPTAPGGTSQWDAFLSFAQNFVYDGTKGPVTPVSIQHPALDFLGINAVLCEDIGAPEKTSDDLMFTSTIELREYFPPIDQSATQTPDGAATSNPDSPGDTSDPAANVLQAQIQGQTGIAVTNLALDGLP